MLTPKELFAAERFETAVRALGTAEDNPALVAGVLLRIAYGILRELLGREAWLALAAKLWDGMEQKKRGDNV